MSDPCILFVDHAAVLGGAELSLLDIATAFRDRSSVVLFEHGPFEQRLLENGVGVEVLGRGERLTAIKKSSSLPSVGSLSAVAQLARQLAARARGADLMYANSPKSFLVTAIAGGLARRPVIWHLRDIVDRSHFSAANIRLLVTVANMRAARVIANSQATADAFVAGGGKRALVRVVHNGIDSAPFDAVSEFTRVAKRAEFGIPEDAFVVGSFSRLHPWKGQRVLLDALDQLPDVHAIVVGGALFSGEESFERELRDRIDQTSLRTRVHMLGVRNDVPALMAACDVIAHTSTSPEPFGRVVVEALLAHRPLVAANDGGVREIVAHNTHALLTPPGDAAALRDAITEVRSNRQHTTAMVAAGSRHVRQLFSREALIANVRREIADALGAQS